MSLFHKRCQCDIVIQMIEGPLHGDYVGNLYKMDELEKQGILELYAGDTPIEDVKRHLKIEDRYTITHYYKCQKCGKTFFIGFCCRGSYIFKVREDSIDNVDFNDIFDGKDKLGTYFNR